MTPTPSSQAASASNTPSEISVLNHSSISRPRIAGRRFVPLISSTRRRTMLGLVMLLLSAVARPAEGNPITSLLSTIMMLFAWTASLWVTHKYVHKYPQRYLPYLAVSHLRATVIFLLVLVSFVVAFGSFGTVVPTPWEAAALFSLVDLLASVPRRKAPDVSLDIDRLIAEWKADGADPITDMAGIDRLAILEGLRAAGAGTAAYDILEKYLPNERGRDHGVVVLGDVTAGEVGGGRAALIVARPRMNDVRHLNAYLEHCANQVAEGGYLVLRYEPLEYVLRNLRQRYSGIRYRLAYACHFVWFRALPKTPKLAALYFRPTLSLDRLYLSVAGRRNRALARAEIWGRLAYWGFDVVAESTDDPESVLLARNVRRPVRNRIPSYHAVVGLEKVGLEGQPLRLHKVRTMFPFSEFLQRRVFEENGLAPSGKFANDFRLTEFGRTLRRYWIDELPQLWDWLRGEIKLVGIRATSRQFLSLYPREFIELYVRVKPGLVPPVFDASVNTLDQIIAVEQTYLERYWKSPVWTDVRYFLQTVLDIALKGVRSK